jgi:mannosyltransferase
VTEAPTDSRPAAAATAGRVDRAVRWVLIGVLAAALVLWVGRFASSLTLDETGPYGVIKDGAGPAMRRAWDVQGQSPLFYLIELGVVRLGGAREAAMRIPALLAMLATLVYLVRLGNRLFGAGAGLVAAATFASYETVRFAAADARPYAPALLACTAATFYLVRWLDEARPRDGAAYVVWAALIVYSHYVFATVLVVHAVYVLARRGHRAPSLKALVTAGAALGVACAPLVPQLLALSRRSASLSWAIGSETLPTLALVLAQPLLLIVIGAVLDRYRERGPDVVRAAVLLAALWAIVPPLINFVLARFTTMKIFHPRYYTAAVPGLFLLIGWLTSRIKVTVLSAAVAVGLLFGSGLPVSRVHYTEDWRGAVRAAKTFTRDASDVVLARVNFIETVDVAKLGDPASFEYAPFSFYRLDAPVHVLPFYMDEQGRAYAKALVERVAAPRYVVIVDTATPNYVKELRSLMASAGYELTPQERSGIVLVATFERR